MARRKTAHIHRYQKAKLGKSFIVMRCNLPNCTHYVDKKLARGLISMCNRCNTPFVLDAAALQLSKPHCKNCTQSKSKPVLDALTELFR